MQQAVEGASNPDSERIPSLPSARIRTLLHDMSNALEIVVQAEYLLSMAETPETTKEWLSLLHRGTQQAIELNKELRDYVRTNS